MPALTTNVEFGYWLHTGKILYGIVRHPMYTTTIFLFLSMPLVLGSLISFFSF